MIHKQSLKFVVFMIVLFVNITKTGYSQEEKNEDVVIIPRGQSRSYMLVNNNSTYYFSETGSINISSFQGLNVETYEFLDDYILEVNGTVLKREISEAYLYPDKLVRKYIDFDLQEEITLLDSLPVLIIKLESNKKLSITLGPFISSQSPSRKFVTYWAEEDKLLYVAKRNHTVRSEREDYPVWTAIYTFPNARFLESDSDVNKSYVGFSKENNFLPGKLNFFLDNTAYIFFIIGDNKNDVLIKRKHVLKQFNIFIEKSGKKIEGVRKT